MFGRLGVPELLIILLIVLVIFGASRLPQLGKGIGQGLKNFKESGKPEPAPLLFFVPSPSSSPRRASLGRGGPTPPGRRTHAGTENHFSGRCDAHFFLWMSGETA